MDAVSSKLEAMVSTNPDRHTTSGRKQAGCPYYRRNRAKKAKYNAEYYKKHQYSINRDKAVKRGNSRKQKLKAVNNMDVVSDCLAKPKAVIAEKLLSDMAVLDGSNALQASFRQTSRLFDSNKNIVV